MTTARIATRLVLPTMLPVLVALPLVVGLAGCGSETVCVEGYTICPLSGGEMCVNLQTDSANCGACGASCKGGEACLAGQCKQQCSLTLCGTECVDVRSDRKHCGTCEIACQAEEICQTGRCESSCKDPLKMCGGSCVAPKTDPKNCGDCGRLCAAAEVCSDGKCVCSGTLTACGGGCVDTTSDPANCGGCGQACKAGEVCAGGKCAPTCGDPPLRQCGGSCVDTSSDAKNCGDCGKACQNNQRCLAGKCGCGEPDKFLRCPDTEAGMCVEKSSPNTCGDCDTKCKVDLHEACVCAEGQCQCQSSCPPDKPVDCGGTCVDPTTDGKNCGQCGNACRDDQQCAAGTCTCPAGKSECGGKCVDLLTDNDNCGRCGEKCGQSQLCSAGSCVTATVIGVTISCSKYELRIGESTTCKAMAQLSNGKQKDVTGDLNTGWASGDSDILEVRDGLTTKGQIVGRGIGTTFVRAILRADGNLQAQHDIRVLNNCLTGVEIVAPHGADATLPGVLGVEWRFYLRGIYQSGEKAILRPDANQTQVWSSSKATVLSFAASFGVNNRRDGLGYVAGLGDTATVSAHWKENNQIGAGCNTANEFDAPPVTVTVRPLEPTTNGSQLTGLVVEPARTTVPQGAAACFRVYGSYGSDGYRIDVTDAHGWALNNLGTSRHFDLRPRLRPPATTIWYTYADPNDPNIPWGAKNQPEYEITQNGPGADPLNGHILCGRIPGDGTQECLEGVSPDRPFAPENFYFYSYPDASQPQICVFTHNATGDNFSDDKLGKIRAYERHAGGSMKANVAYIKVSGATAMTCAVHSWGFEPCWQGRVKGFVGHFMGNSLSRGLDKGCDPNEPLAIIPTGAARRFGVVITLSSGEPVWWHDVYGNQDPRYVPLTEHLTWNSSNSSVLEADGQGWGQGLMAGEANLLATLGDQPCTPLPVAVVDAVLQNLFVVQGWRWFTEWLSDFMIERQSVADCKDFDFYRSQISDLDADPFPGPFRGPLARPFGQQVESSLQDPNAVYSGLYGHSYGLLPNEPDFSLSYRAVAAYSMQLADGRNYCLYQDRTDESEWQIVDPVQLNDPDALGPVYPRQPDRDAVSLGNTVGQKGVVTSKVGTPLRRIDGIQAKYREYVSGNPVVVEVCGKKDMTSLPTNRYVIAYPLYLFKPQQDPMVLLGPNPSWQPVTLSVGDSAEVIAMARISNPSTAGPCYHAATPTYFIDVSEQSQWTKDPSTATNILIGDEGASKGVVEGVAKGSDGGAVATYAGTKSNVVPFKVIGAEIVRILGIAPQDGTIRRVRAFDPNQPTHKNGQRWMGEYQQMSASVELVDGTQTTVTDDPQLLWFPLHDPNDPAMRPGCVAVDPDWGLLPGAAAQGTNFDYEQRCKTAVVACLASDDFCSGGWAEYFLGNWAEAWASIQAARQQGTALSTTLTVDGPQLDSADPFFITTQDRNCYQTPPTEVPVYRWKDASEKWHFTTTKLHACLKYQRPLGATVDLDRFYNDTGTTWQSLNTACLKTAQEHLGEATEQTMGEFVPVATGCQATVQAFSGGKTANMLVNVIDTEITGLDLSASRNQNGAGLPGGCDGPGGADVDVCLIAGQTEQLVVKPLFGGRSVPDADQAAMTYSRCLQFTPTGVGAVEVGNRDSTAYWPPANHFIPSQWVNGFVRTSGEASVVVSVLGMASAEDEGVECDLRALVGAKAGSLDLLSAPTPQLDMFEVTHDATGQLNPGDIVQFSSRYRARFGGPQVTVDMTNDADCSIQKGALGFEVFSWPQVVWEGDIPAEPDYMSSPYWTNCIGLAREVDAATQVSVTGSVNGAVPVTAVPDPIIVGP